jgi:cold shock CspA family protein
MTSPREVEPPGAVQVGAVESFDAAVGLGTVATAEGHRFLFHCTAIADGTRDIQVGAAVAFLVGAGGPGTWEARSVRPLV